MSPSRSIIWVKIVLIEPILHVAAVGILTLHYLLTQYMLSTVGEEVDIFEYLKTRSIKQY